MRNVTAQWPCLQYAAGVLGRRPRTWSLGHALGHAAPLAHSGVQVQPITPTQKPRKSEASENGHGWFRTSDLSRVKRASPAVRRCWFAGSLAADSALGDSNYCRGLQRFVAVVVPGIIPGTSDAALSGVALLGARAPREGDRKDLRTRQPGARSRGQPWWLGKKRKSPGSVPAPLNGFDPLASCVLLRRPHPRPPQPARSPPVAGRVSHGAAPGTPQAAPDRPSTPPSDLI
jgi:hypothetical protein